jgi:ABC-type sugar transport system permease subunit
MSEGGHSLPPPVRPDIPVLRQPRRTTTGGWNRKAIWSIAFAISGIYPLMLVGAIPALIVGKKAKRELAQGIGERGRGLAQAAIIIGWCIVSVAVALLVWLSYVCSTEHCG